jgi:hypothetical protein
MSIQLKRVCHPTPGAGLWAGRRSKHAQQITVSVAATLITILPMPVGANPAEWLHAGCMS